MRSLNTFLSALHSANLLPCNPRYSVVLITATTPDGDLHVGHCSHLTAAPNTPLALQEYINNNNLCPRCSPNLEREVNRSSDGVRYLKLLTVHQDTTALLNAIDRKELGPTRVARLTRNLDQHRRDLRESAHLLPTAEVTRIDTHAAHALTQLRDASAGSPTLALHEAICALQQPATRTAQPATDTEMVLASIYPTADFTDLALAALSMLALPRPDQLAGTVVHAPRYVINHLHRNAGTNRNGANISAIPAGDDQYNHTVAQLWDPTTTGPLASLAHAATAAAGLTHTP